MRARPPRRARLRARCPRSIARDLRVMPTPDVSRETSALFMPNASRETSFFHPREKSKQLERERSSDRTAVCRRLKAPSEERPLGNREEEGGRRRGERPSRASPESPRRRVGKARVGNASKAWQGRGRGALGERRGRIGSIAEARSRRVGRMSATRRRRIRDVSRGRRMRGGNACESRRIERTSRWSAAWNAQGGACYAHPMTVAAERPPLLHAAPARLRERLLRAAELYGRGAAEALA